MISVLYVDDEPDLLEIGKLFLEAGEELRVSTAIAAEDGLAQLAENTIDAIISDYQMPGMNGIGFLKEVRKQYGDRPFILFTGKGREEVVIEAINNGADFYLQKGGEPRAQFAELEHKVRQAVARWRAERSLRKSEALFRGLFDQAFQRVAVLDTKGNLVSVNQTALALVNKKPADVIGLPFWETPWWEGDTRLQEKLKEAITRSLAGETVRFEIQLRDYRGNLRDTDFSIKPVTDEYGAVIALLPEGRDITALKETELELRQAKEAFRTFLDHSYDAVFIHDAQDHLLDVNATMLGMFRLDYDEALAYTVADYSGPKHPTEEVREHWKRVMAGEDQFFPWQARRPKDGTLFDVEIYQTRVDLQGRPLIVSYVRDVSDRKKTAEVMQENETKYRRLIESTLDIIYETDERGTLTFIGPQVRKYGFEPGDLVGLKVYELVCPADRDAIRKDLENLIQDGTNATSRFRVQTRDGKILWFEDFSKERRDNGGTVIGTNGIIREITDRIAAETALRESEERFRSYVVNANDIVYTLSPQGIFTYVSPCWTEKLGQETSEVVGKSFEHFVHPDDIQACRKFLEKVISTGERTGGIEYRALHKNGTWRWHTTNASAGRDEHGRIITFLGIAHDITGRKLAEEALSQANRKLAILASMTRHDIRNQLLALRGYLQLSETRLDDKEKLPEFIQKEIQIAEIIGHQIDFSQDYQDMGATAPVWQGVEAMIDRSAAALPVGSVTIAVECPSLEILADPLFEKVFYNLIDNALRYGGESLTTIRISARESGHNLLLLCEDDGAGIPEEEKTEIFARGHGKNTGLGLFLVREILGITGMNIRESGGPGKGARFEILVPEGSFRMPGKITS